MSRKKVAKEYAGIVDAAEEQGWRVEKIADGYQLFAPDGVTIVTIHLTEGDVRAMRNTIARMRGAGFIWRRR